MGFYFEVIMDEVRQHPLWKEVVKEVLATFDHGDLIPKSWLLERLEINEPAAGSRKDYNRVDFDWLENIEKIKAELLEGHNVYLHWITGKGYLVVPPGDQAAIAWQEMRKAIKKALRKTYSALVNIKAGQLTTAQRAEQNNKIAALSLLQQNVKKANRRARLGLPKAGEK